MTTHIIGPNDPALDVLQAAITKKPELDTHLTIIPWSDYRDALMKTLTADQAPNQAVFIPGHVWLPELAAQGLLAPVDNLMEDVPHVEIAAYNSADILPNVAAESRYLGKQYLLPLFTDGHILFYRSDLIDIDGYENVPVISHLDLHALAVRVHNPPDVYGIALKAHPSEIFLDWLPFLWASGGDILDENQQPALASEAGLQALEAYCNLREFCPPATHQYGNAEIAEILRNGKAALTTTWGGQAAPIFLDTDNIFRQVYKSAVFPKPWNATWGIALPVSQPLLTHQKTLQVLLKVTGPAQDEEIIKVAGSPVRENTYSSQAFEQYHWLAAQYQMLKTAGFLPLQPETDQYLGTLYESIYAAFTGELTPQDALSQAQTMMLTVLRKD